jgi:glycerol kinase
VDGGAAANDLLCELQAAQLQVEVRRPVVAETTALGAAFLAGLATGVWSSLRELADTWRLDRAFPPGLPEGGDGGYRRWQQAVHRSRGWASL